MIGGAALDGGGDDLPALFLGLVLQLLLDLLDLHGSLVANLVLDAFQQVFLGLLLGQLGDLLQLLELLLADRVHLSLGLGNLLELLCQLLFLALKGFGLLIEGGFLLFQAALLLAQLGAALLDFLFVLCARFMDFVLGLQKHFLLSVFTGADGFVDQAGGLRLSGADLPLGDLLAVDNAEAKAHSQTRQQTQNGKNNLYQSHKFAAHLLLKNRRRRGGAYTHMKNVHNNRPRATTPREIEKAKRQQWA